MRSQLLASRSRYHFSACRLGNNALKTTVSDSAFKVIISFFSLSSITAASLQIQSIFVHPATCMASGLFVGTCRTSQLRFFGLEGEALHVKHDLTMMKATMPLYTQNVTGPICSTCMWSTLTLLWH